MGSFSIWHGLIVLFWLVVLGWPIAKILKRMGYSGWWTILAFVPLVNIIGLWVVSIIRWPAIDRQ